MRQKKQAKHQSQEVLTLRARRAVAFRTSENKSNSADCLEQIAEKLAPLAGNGTTGMIAEALGMAKRWAASERAREADADADVARLDLALSRYGLEPVLDDDANVTDPLAEPIHPRKPRRLARGGDATVTQ